MVMLFDYILFEFTTVRNDTCVMCDLEFKNILSNIIDNNYYFIVFNPFNLNM